MRKIPKLRFKEFSDDWEEKRLGDLILLQRGSSPRPIIKYITNSSDGVNWIKIGDTNKESKYITSTSEKITKEGAKKSREVKKGEIILSNSMSYGRPFILKIDGYIHDGWFVIRKYEKNFNKEFLCQLLGSDFIQLQYKKVAAGGVVENISSELVNSVKVKVLSLKEQEKIANFLSGVDKKIYLTEEKLELFREYKKGVMQKIFSQELRFKDNEGNDYPEWKEEKLKNLSKIITKQTGFDYSSTIKPSLVTERKPNTIPFIQNKDFKGKYINYNTDFYIPEFIQNKFLKITLNEKCILITISGNIGNIGLFDYKELSFIGGAVGVIKLKNISMLEYIYYYLISDKCQRKIISNEKTSAHKNITIEDIRELIVFLPCYEEQQKIADFLSSIDIKIEKIENELENLKEFKKGLLQQMFV